MMENTIKSVIKRIILVLIAVLMLGMATGCKMESFSSMGDAEYTERGLEVRLYGLSEDKTEYMVTGIGNCTDTDIVIPESYNGLPITKIGDRAFMDCSNITSVNIPNSVITIERWAFKNCTNLSEIQLSNNLGLLFGSAFDNCISLASISLPASLTIIEGIPFSGCCGLIDITVDSGNDIYHSNGNCVIETATKTLIRGCPNSVIPDDGSVTKLGSGSFDGCINVKSFVIPDSIEIIGSSAFANCTSLESVYIPTSVTSIGVNAFSGSNLTNVYYAGTESEWYDINIEDYDNSLTQANRHYNSK